MTLPSDQSGKDQSHHCHMMSHGSIFFFFFLGGGGGGVK